MPKSLKITNRTGQVLYDSTWIAGVGDDDDDDEDMYDEMDPDAIAALNDPTTLQDDEDNEDSDEEEQPQVKEPDEEESEEESEEEQDPNPTTAKEQTIPENARMTRSGRISKPRQVLNLYQSHLQAEAHQEVSYSLEIAHVIAVHHHVPPPYQDQKPQWSTSLSIHPDLQSKEWIKEVWRAWRDRSNKRNAPAPRVSCIWTHLSQCYDSTWEEKSHGKFDIPCWKARWKS